jgi:prepilin-type N-terminal cleavage/methylation domain-containing protein
MRDFTLMNSKKKAAFTLAEVLITLGIIGIVAAMTIPSLIHNQQKKVLENRLKEDYSIMQQVMRFNEYDDLYLDTNIPDNITGATNWFKTYLAPHLKYAQVCYDAAGCWQSKMNNRQLNGNVAGWNRLGVGIGYGIITVRLTNGSNLCIDGFSASDMMNWFGIKSTTSGIIVYIDANGDGGPNVIGKDIFILGFTEKGLVPAGQDVTNEKVDASCKKGGNGYFCMKKVKDSGWEIPYDVWKMKV